MAAQFSSDSAPPFLPAKPGELTTLPIPDSWNPAHHPLPRLSGKGSLWIGHFQAMASDCEILMEGITQAQAATLLQQAVRETWRIEHKFSRYLQGNIIDRINNSAGQPIKVDEETAALLDFADQCYQLSDGLFDISSGVLRRIWRFDGSAAVPSPEQIEALLPWVGWQQVKWQAPWLTLKPGMELDFGGIGKEYAVDKVVLTLKAATSSFGANAFVVNFGGDLACSGARLDGQPWVVGVESSERDASAVATVSLRQGAVATSGDSRRYLLKDGARYSHILNPKTGVSVLNAPHAVSVAAPTCLQAGMLSTLAMLHGADAEAFLQLQEVQHWIQR